MPPILFADNYLAGSLLTLLLPVCLLIAIAVWFVLVFRRVPEDTPVSSPSLPSPEAVAAAAPPAADDPPPVPPASD